MTLILEKKEGAGTLGPFENLTFNLSECHEQGYSVGATTIWEQDPL